MKAFESVSYGSVIAEPAMSRSDSGWGDSMEEKDIKEILNIIFIHLKNKKFKWYIDGSANLRIQGIKISVNDFDITTNKRGIKIFRKCMKEYLIKDFYSEKIKGTSLLLDINGFTIEINSYGDRDKSFFNKRCFKNLEGLSVPLFPLENAKDFYESVGYGSKVKIISDFLEK